MQPYAIKSLVIGALVVAVIAGCAAPSTSPVASAQGSVQKGKVSSIESAAAAGQPTAPSSSGSSAIGTTASSEPAIVTVGFADGTQGRYSIDQHSPRAFAVGDPVLVNTNGDRITIVSPLK